MACIDFCCIFAHVKITQNIKLINMETKKNITAVIYARVSTNGQDYERQLNDLQDYASRMGYIVVKEFAEKTSEQRRWQSVKH